MPGSFHGVRKAVNVHASDQNSTGPAGGQKEVAVAPVTHPLMGTGEMKQGEHGERKLQREHDLAERKQIGDAAVAAQADDDDCRQDRQRARDEPSHPRLDAPVHEAFHHDLACERSGDGAALSGGEESYGEESAGNGCTQQRGKCEISDADPITIGTESDKVSARNGNAFLAKEYCRSEDQNGGVHKEGDGERDRGVDGVELQGAADRGVVLLQFAALHQGRVQIQIVRHDGGADDADGHVEHACLAKVRRQKCLAQLEEMRARLGKNEYLDEIACADGRDQQQDHCFDCAHAKALQSKKQKYVKAGDDDRPEQWNVEEEVEGNGTAEDLGEIAGADGDFAHQPVGPARPRRVPVAAALGKVFAGDDAEARGNHLHKDGHQAGEADDPQQTVLELSAALEIGAPVAGIHVADADEDGGADEGAPLLPKAGLMMRNFDGTVYVLERQVAAGRSDSSGSGKSGTNGFFRTTHSNQDPQTCFPDRLGLNKCTSELVNYS